MCHHFTYSLSVLTLSGGLAACSLLADPPSGLHTWCVLPLLSITNPSAHSPHGSRGLGPLTSLCILGPVLLEHYTGNQSRLCKLRNLTSGRPLAFNCLAPWSPAAFTDKRSALLLRQSFLAPLYPLRSGPTSFRLILTLLDLQH